MMMASATSSRMPPIVDKALVVGGGLGGLSAAIHLRNIGIDAHVYDKYERLSGGEGTVISIFPNGCRALQKANPFILDQMKMKGCINTQSVGVTPKGERVTEWELSTQMEKKYGHPLITILWQDALRILWDALPEECKHVGYECYDLTQSDEETVVHFTKGTENISIKSPLVVGVDGVNSTLRRVLFGVSTPRDNGRTMWRAIIDENACQHEALVPGNLGTMQNGRTLFIINGLQGKLYWAMSVTDECTNGETKVRSKDANHIRERLLSYYQGWDVATALIQATNPEVILERRVLDVPVLPKWSSGRTVLLGDAVHAVTPSYGQGANLAFEDGLELAKQLSISPNLSDAFESYEKARIPRTSAICEKSQALGVRPSDEFYDWIYNFPNA